MNPEAPMGIDLANVDWSNVTAIAVILGLFVWLITKAMPAVFLKWEATLNTQRSDFLVKLNESEDKFIESLEQQSQHYDKWKEESRVHGERQTASTNNLRDATLKLHQSLEDLPNRLTDVVKRAVDESHSSKQS
jgi:hypothetical protein